MGHIEVSELTYVLPDGRPLLDGVSFRVGEGAKAALVGPNGAGKTTLLRLIAGDLPPAGGRVARSGGLGVMRQFIGGVRDGRTVRDLLLSVAPEGVRAAAVAVARAEAALARADDEPAQLAYAQALADYADAGGYEAEVVWDTCATAALGLPYDRVEERPVNTLSGGEQKRLVLEALLRGPDELLLLDEPDNYLDVPAKQWLEERLRAVGKTVLLVSHDRRLLANTADRILTVEDRGVWVHGGGFASYAQARHDRVERLEELKRRWEEEHARLRQLVNTLRQTAANNDAVASSYRAARTRLRRFEEAGPPERAPRGQNVRMRLRGGRTGKRAVVCESVELPGLVRPFDLEIWHGERVAVLGSNGTGKSHFLRLLAGMAPGSGTGMAPGSGTGMAPGSGTGMAPGSGAGSGPGPRPGSDPGSGAGAGTGADFGSRSGVGPGSGPDACPGAGSGSHAGAYRGLGPGTDSGSGQGYRHAGVVRLGARVAPGHFAQTHARPELHGRTAADLVTQGHALTLNEAMAALARYELAPAARRPFETLSGGQQARLQILLLELSGATLLLLDEPTDNLDLASAEALQQGLACFEGTVVAVTHDRWFAADFDRFLIFGADGRVRESSEPVWAA
ncbi:ATP-binding cassette domain-containing protein [Sphaerisporangium sp. NPDC005288]|uniref:ABC-F family ATP-binding cassette domain-containing protein n=1 Tax=Sphaerisporangium sp. NPDC005288 TaxID=3155114 RepID=UPI0033BAE9CF